MLINYCFESFVKINCCQLSSDDCCPQNLISNDLTKRQKGFRSESFIRPPIDIIIEVLNEKFSLNIKTIEIGLKLGENQTKGLEIFYSNNCWEKEFSRKIINHFIENEEKQVLIVENIGFSPNLRTNNAFSPKTQTNDGFFQTNQMPEKNITIIRKNFYTEKIKRIKIRILNTFSQNIPSIKFLNIWGKSFGEIIPQTIENPLKNEFTFYGNSGLNEIKRREERKRKREEDEDNDDSIPEEFIDPLTKQVMTIPVLLPSGQSVDQTSLDKYIREESAWGRSPNDPFTGLVFTAERKPKLNPILKQRIDCYLTKNSTKDMYERISGHSLSFTPTVNSSVRSRLLNNATNGRTVVDQIEANRVCVACNVIHCNIGGKGIEGSDAKTLYELLCCRKSVICREKVFSMKNIFCPFCKTLVSEKRFFSKIETIS